MNNLKYIILMLLAINLYSNENTNLFNYFNEYKNKKLIISGFSKHFEVKDKKGYKYKYYHPGVGIEFDYKTEQGYNSVTLAFLKDSYHNNFYFCSYGIYKNFKVIDIGFETLIGYKKILYFQKLKNGSQKSINRKYKIILDILPSIKFKINNKYSINFYIQPTINFKYNGIKYHFPGFIYQNVSILF